MGKRKKLLTLIAALVLVIALPAILASYREPQYQGRPLHQWIDLLGAPAPRTSPAAEAIQHIGTNAIPLLLQWIAYEWQPSKSKQRVATLPFLKRLAPVSRWLYGRDPLQFRADQAAAAFEVLGPGAASAIPELARLAAYSSEARAAHRAVDALVNIGLPSVPALLTVITNRKAEVCFYVVRSIQNLGTNARPAVPTLLLCRGDGTLALAIYETLGRLKLEPQLVIPALQRTASDPDPIQRAWAITVLGDYGSEARAATPTVLAALSDSHPTVRDSATNALQAIAPEALTNHQPVN